MNMRPFLSCGASVLCVCVALSWHDTDDVPSPLVAPLLANRLDAVDSVHAAIGSSGPSRVAAAVDARPMACALDYRSVVRQSTAGRHAPAMVIGVEGTLFARREQFRDSTVQHVWLLPTAVVVEGYPQSPQNVAAGELEAVLRQGFLVRQGAHGVATALAVPATASLSCRLVLADVVSQLTFAVHDAPIWTDVRHRPGVVETLCSQRQDAEPGVIAFDCRRTALSHRDEQAPVAPPSGERHSRVEWVQAANWPRVVVTTDAQVWQLGEVLLAVDVALAVHPVSQDAVAPSRDIAAQWFPIDCGTELAMSREQAARQAAMADPRSAQQLLAGLIAAANDSRRRRECLNVLTETVRAGVIDAALLAALLRDPSLDAATFGAALGAAIRAGAAAEPMTLALLADASLPADRRAVLYGYCGLSGHASPRLVAALLAADATAPVEGDGALLAAGAVTRHAGMDDAFAMLVSARPAAADTSRTAAWLRALGNAGERAAAVVLPFLGDAEPSLRVAAIDALTACRDPQVDAALSRCLQDGDVGVRGRAVRAHAARVAAGRLPELAPILQDEDVGIRRQLVRGLCDRRDAEAARPLLLQLANSDPDAGVRSSAAAALSRNG